MRVASSQHKHQEKYFDRDMKTWENYHLEPWQNSFLQRLRESFLKKGYKGKLLLDVGAGSGYVSVEMAKLGMEVIALDLSRQAVSNLEKFKKQYKLFNLKPVLGKAEKINLKDASVDYLVGNAILEHIVAEEETIIEWKRVLKKDGRIYITVPIKFRYIWPWFWPVNYIHDRRIGHLRRYDKVTLERKFGMNVEKVYYTGHLVKTIWVLMSLFVKSRKMDELMEKLDAKLNNFAYGASNISVVLVK